MNEQEAKPTLSVIIPALDEEANIAAAVQEVIQAIGDRFADYELLLFDDGSQDQTGRIMDELAAGNAHIRVTHNPQPRNVGGVYKQGLAMASFDYLTWVPGDNENPASALIGPFDAIGSADIVVPFTANPHVRTWRRRLASRVYVVLLNVLFGRRLKYYNGTAIYRTKDLRSITINTDSFAFQSEVLIKLLRAGRSYVEVGIEIQPRGGRNSKALRVANLINVFVSIGRLVREIHFQ